MESVSREQALEFLETQSVAHLGMISGGAPYVTPMSYVTDGERILFRTMAGRKLDGLRTNPAVCIEVSLFDEETGNWVSVIVRGEAHFIDDDTTKQEMVARLFAKYEKVMGSPLSGSTPTPPGGVPYVIEVPIAEITGMSSHGGLGARTRPGRL